MKLLVRNICRDTTEAELRVMFEKYGAVQSCTLVIDEKTGLSKGFGFIEMPKGGQAKLAMKSLNGTQIGGATMRVKKASAKQTQSNAEEIETTERKSGSGDKLHGVTLEMIVTQLVSEYGWDGLGKKIDISCFTTNPGMTSSLKFLRKTVWAREKVEILYQRLTSVEKSVEKIAPVLKNKPEKEKYDPSQKPEYKQTSQPKREHKQASEPKPEHKQASQPKSEHEQASPPREPKSEGNSNKTVKKNPWGTIIDDDN